uniref:Potassium channel domain-containing protein n=1 Tax=Ciona savignyi TaxID=51511 RepID=H2ZBT0_CIOSA
MDLKTLGCLIVAYFIYLLLGAAVFSAIEGPIELQNCRESQRILDEAIKNLRNGNLTENRLRYLVETMALFYENGIPLSQNISCENRNWNFQSAFFFAGTIVTTIGYGHITPSTRGSRAFCIIYALLGIPLFAIMFSGLSALFGSALKRVSTMLDNKEMHPFIQNLAIFFVFVSVGFLLFCFIPAVIISAAEQWEYSDSIYYAIITLTTIGFGDFVAGDNPHMVYTPLYRVMVYFWILFGLAYMATVINVLTERFRQRGLSIKKRLTGYEEAEGENGAENGQPTHSKTSSNGEDNISRENNAPNETSSLKNHSS